MTRKILLIFMILFLPTIVFAEKIPDYYDPYAPIYTDKQIYSWTDKIRIAINAPSWNENIYRIDHIGDIQGYFVKISTHVHTLEGYRLEETAPNSGLFTGEVTLTGFPHDVDADGDIDTQPKTGGTGPTNGFLETDRDDGLTISFEFADGVVLTQNAQVRWNHGQISFNKSLYEKYDDANIQVIDPDMNLNPETTDTITVQLSSDSDKAGIKIDAIETNQDSGVFKTKVSFTQSGSSSGNRLFTSSGDIIYAKYEDNTLPNPYGINDSLDIITKSLFGSSQDLDKVKFENLVLTNWYGNQIQKPIVGQQVQVISHIENSRDYDQPFVYLIQIKNSSNTIVSLTWLKGSLVANQKLDVSQSWMPLEIDSYTIDAFVWASIDNPIPLAPSMTSTYNVT